MLLTTDVISKLGTLRTLKTQNYKYNYSIKKKDYQMITLAFKSSLFKINSFYNSINYYKYKYIFNIIFKCALLFSKEGNIKYLHLFLLGCKEKMALVHFWCKLLLFFLVDKGETYIKNYKLQNCDKNS